MISPFAAACAERRHVFPTIRSGQGANPQAHTLGSPIAGPPSVSWRSARPMSAILLKTPLVVALRGWSGVYRQWGGSPKRELGIVIT